MTITEFNHQLLKLDKQLMGYASSLTESRYDAEDLLQETYLKALQYREKFKPLTNLKAWTFTIMKNTFINKYRRLKLEKNKLLKKDNLYNEGDEIPYDTIGSQQTINDLSGDINSLDDKHKLPLQMLLSGYKYEEIAMYLDLNIGTVKSRIFFARKRLKHVYPELV